LINFLLEPVRNFLERRLDKEKTGEKAQFLFLQNEGSI